MQTNFLIYGANGYTGALTARMAAARGLRPILAGRNATEVAALAEELDLPYRIAGLDDPAAIDALLADVVLVLGSQNSSNSQRLRELGAEQGKRAYLIDGVEDLSADWFHPEDRILVTAGASAPESVVQATIDWLVEKFGATLREETVRKEEVHFPLPKPLRDLAKADPDCRLMMTMPGVGPVVALTMRAESSSCRWKE